MYVFGGLRWGFGWVGLVGFFDYVLLVGRGR